MKTWWLFLLILTCLLGCAPGSYEPEQGSIYQGAESQKFYRNPETPEEQQQRIWWEKSHH
jgi:hypothetical protein